MDSLVLLVLVPLMLVPVVLLWGFAGCKFDPQGIVTHTLSNLQVTGVTRSSVSLRWTNPDPLLTAFEVERTIDGGDPIILPASTTTFEDVDLDEATTYIYRVRVTPSDDAETPFTTAVAATTGIFEPAFTAVLTISQGNLEGFCLIQRIEPLRLFKSGNEVRLTVRGSTGGDLTIDRIFISRVGTTGDPYDAAADLTLVATNVVVPAGNPVTLDPIAYAFDRTKPVLIAFDINPTPGQGNAIRLEPIEITEGAMYFKDRVAEAAIPDRIPSPATPGVPYEISDSVYIVERIEVA